MKNFLEAYALYLLLSAIFFCFDRHRYQKLLIDFIAHRPLFLSIHLYQLFLGLLFVVGGRGEMGLSFLCIQSLGGISLFRAFYYFLLPKNYFSFIALLIQRYAPFWIAGRMTAGGAFLFLQLFS